MAKKKSPTKEPKPTGRPTLYTEKLADQICNELADGKSLVRICAPKHMPNRGTVVDWLNTGHKLYKPSFAVKYARARELQADKLAEEIIEIADDSSGDTTVDENGKVSISFENVQRSRLRMDARKWYAGKLRPKKYGEKLQQEVTGPDGGPLQITSYTLELPDNGRGDAK